MTTSYRGRREFRAGTGMIIAIVLTWLIFAAGAVMTYQLHGWYWVSIGLTCGAVLSLVGIVETLLLRIHLAEDALLVTDLRGVREYHRNQIVRVEEAKGAPTAILLTDGQWVRLPPVGSGLGNSIRAWLRQPPSSPASPASS